MPAQMIAAYKTAGIPPEHVFAQSFDLNDILFWVKTEPAFGAQAVYLEDRYEKRGLDPSKPETWKPSMSELKASGVQHPGAADLGDAGAERRKARSSPPPTPRPQRTPAST